MRALAVHKAAGTYVPRLKQRPCFYGVQEIRDNRRLEISAMEQQIAAHRDHAPDREWAHRRADAESSAPVALFAHINLPADAPPVEVLPDWLAGPDVAAGFQAAAALHRAAQGLFPVAAAVQRGLVALVGM